MDIQILDLTDTHKLCVVTTRKGYSHSCSWAIERDENNKIASPTIEHVKEAWDEDRKVFQRYSMVVSWNV